MDSTFIGAIYIHVGKNRSRILQMKETAPDIFVEKNRQLLLQRSNVGVVKYGTTLQTSKARSNEWAQHAIEEALDLANYLQVLRYRLINKQPLVDTALEQCDVLDSLASSLVDNKELFELGCAIRDEITSLRNTLNMLGEL